MLIKNIKVIEYRKIKYLKLLYSARIEAYSLTYKIGGPILTKISVALVVSQFACMSDLASTHYVVPTYSMSPPDRARKEVHILEHVTQPFI